MTKPRPMPWREVLIVNGCLSFVLGVGAYVVLQCYAADLDAWIRDHSTEKVKAAAEVLVLGYMAYAVAMIAVVMLSVFLPHWLGKRWRGGVEAAANEVQPRS